jgi:hypothetical protein
MHTLQWIVLIGLIILPFILAGAVKDAMGFLVGIILSGCISFGILGVETPTGKTQLIHLSRIITESGPFSATFHIKNKQGRVVKSIRIEKANELDAFNKGNYQLIEHEVDHFWVDPYYSDNMTFEIMSNANNISPEQSE